MIQPAVRIRSGVRMRKCVGEVAPDLAVVGMLHKRCLVRVAPRAHHALRQRDAQVGE